MTFTKADLIDKVHASNPKMTKAQAREAVVTILRIIKSSLENGEDVLLTGFGKFTVKHKSERMGSNPKTGKPLMFAAREMVTFKTSPKLREKVNNS